MDRTSWRGLAVAHPRHWEVAVASGPADKRRLVLADRYRQRLDIQWKVDLPYAPVLDKVMDRYKQQDGAAVEFQVDRNAPEPWSVVVHPLATGCIVYAGRVFPESRAMVEARVLWPGRRDVNLERDILLSLELPEGLRTRTWRALGMDVDVANEYDLISADTHVGRIVWKFASEDRDQPTIDVERIALVEHWLDQPLRDWMLEQLPGGFRCDRQEVYPVGPHRGERLLSSSRAGIVGTLRGRRDVRMDIAWQCPLEARIYRVTVQCQTARAELAWPDPLVVRCCKPVTV